MPCPQVNITHVLLHEAFAWLTCQHHSSAAADDNGACCVGVNKEIADNEEVDNEDGNGSSSELDKEVAGWCSTHQI